MANKRAASQAVPPKRDSSRTDPVPAGPQLPAEQDLPQEPQHWQPQPTPHPRPQLRPDGRWWWNGYRWVPMPPGAGALAWWAMGFGICNASILFMFLLGGGLAEPAPVTGYNPGGGGLLLALASLPGVVLGILALARPGYGHDRRRRRSLAWIAIGLSMFSIVGWLCLFLFA